MDISLTTEPHPKPARTALGALLAAGAIIAALGTAVHPAAADTPGDPPGDNGTVKVVDPEDPSTGNANEPHVCTFKLVGSGFDRAQEVSWEIDEWAPGGQKGTQVLSGGLTIGDDGNGETQVYELPDGHYKLFWNFEGEHGNAKQKVFWVDCENGDDGNGDNGDNGDNGNGNGNGDNGGNGNGDGDGDGPRDGAAGGNGSLPVTGTGVDLTAAGIALVCAGAAIMVLTLRRTANGGPGRRG
ncbi:hypothetical protein O4J56_13705 [Nocardiopsis sp. RSe5-2]|uniref:LPXTG cell wall anchor domain-containing protein n=1 Tax=Nocardiopsis endophytica TaxID=3018445 RepID=A0ABT4U408_9ACTN|nr:hypothetical protein [Nocardiopsis endophytica]MDA2811691.1 hypothetical protein [Nocardiopsis endophytica]